MNKMLPFALETVDNAEIKLKVNVFKFDVP